MKQGLWEAPDETAAEVEMGEFLYGLVRMLKPQLVVETGTYKGHSTKWLSLAIYMNNRGHLVTCDPYEYGEIEGIFDKRSVSSLDLPELREADFVFSDSDQNIRAAEYELVKPGCVFVVHDTDQSFNGQKPDDWLGEWVRSKGGLTFHAGRGFGLLIKPS